MPTIRLLPDTVINQIAAGEVIERPVAIVKELVENSLDAKATQIGITFKNGGKSYICVEDNGHGMTSDEARLALQRHATSKLCTADDLRRITSFGFRGEALPSIAAVAQLTLRTRAGGSPTHGTEILIDGGKLIHQRDYGMPIGTTLTIEHLFNTVPARRKFLKTDNTEAAHIIHLARLLAIANPNTAFRLTEDNRPLFTSPRCRRLRDRIVEIWGPSIATQLREIEVVQDGDLRLYGLLGRPGFSRATRQELVTIVNRRPVESRTLSYAILESYHTLIPKGRYPVAFLFLEIDPAAIDVNVHPAKREIRFTEESAVRHFVIQSVSDFLKTAFSPKTTLSPPTPPSSQSHAPTSTQPPMTPSKAKTPPSGLPHKTTTLPSHSSSHHHHVSPSPNIHPRSNKASPPNPSSSPPAGKRTQTSEPSAQLSCKNENLKASEAPLPWRFIGHLYSHQYALFEAEAGLVCLDLRAAHERLNFEALQERFCSDATEMSRQPLLLPVPLELEPRSAAALKEHFNLLEKAGFTLTEFGRNFFRIESVPDWLDPSQSEIIVRDLLQNLQERGRNNRLNADIMHGTLARLAAARALRREDTLTETSVIDLARRLLNCKQPLTSPRGRPTYFELPRSEIEKRLGRTHTHSHPNLEP